MTNFKTSEEEWKSILDEIEKSLAAGKITLPTREDWDGRDLVVVGKIDPAKSSSDIVKQLMRRRRSASK